MYKKSIMVILSLALVFSLSLYVFAQAVPEGPSTLTEGEEGRRQAAAYKTQDAYAGNISQLTIDGQTVTQSWQGYYGNISGTITLDDASGNTLFDWNLASPEGEIYASEKEVDFSTGNVLCYNYSKSGSDYIDLSEYEITLGLNDDDLDGVNETFSETSHESFYVGGQEITGDCPAVRLYNGTNESTAGIFEEALLYYDKDGGDGSQADDSIVYTAIIEETEPVGFNGKHWDFQMIVGEDGHDGDTATTEYKFYVELE